MWYDDSYNLAIQAIKNNSRKLSEKEYRSIAKELNLLNPESLRCITQLDFLELVKKVRSKEDIS